MSQNATTQDLNALWYTRCPVPTPLGLAAQLGWFTEEFAPDRLEIRTLQEVDDPGLRESHYDHHLHNSFRQGGNVPAIWARAKGADTRVIGLNWVDESQLIIALPNSGIRNPEDLRGRRVGLPLTGNTIDHARAGALKGFLETLKLGELRRDHVHWVDVPTGQGSLVKLGGYSALLDALARYEVDAVYVKGARGLDAANRIGAHIVQDLRSHPDRLVRANNGAPRPITVDAQLLRQRPDLVARFLARIVAIGDWAAAHPAETFAYVSRETRAEERWVRQAYGEDLHLRQTTDLAESSIQALESYKDFLFAEGFLPADFSVAEWIDAGPLHEIDRYLHRKIA